MKSGTMDMIEFSAMNRTRCESVHGFAHRLSGWTLSDWFTATHGEYVTWWPHMESAREWCHKRNATAEGRR